MHVEWPCKGCAGGRMIETEQKQVFVRPLFVVLITAFLTEIVGTITIAIIVVTILVVTI